MLNEWFNWSIDFYQSTVSKWEWNSFCESICSVCYSLYIFFGFIIFYRSIAEDKLYQFLHINIFYERILSQTWHLFCRSMTPRVHLEKNLAIASLLLLQCASVNFRFEGQAAFCSYTKFYVTLLIFSLYLLSILFYT